MKENKILLFGRKKCALCEGWKRKLNHLGLPYTYYDTDETDGLATMAWHNVARIPALVIGEKRFEEISPAALTSGELKKLANRENG